MNNGKRLLVSGTLALGGLAILSSTKHLYLSGQASPAITVFSAVESSNGVTLRADQHSIVTCSENASSSIAIASLQSSIIRFWAYEYLGTEPQGTGKFYISPGEIAIHPEYAAIDTLRTFSGGKRYYIMTEMDLLFRCGQGLSKPSVCGDRFLDREEQCDDGNSINNDGCTACRLDAACGNGIVERAEACDTDSDGCNQSTCTAQDGYVCNGNTCTIFIPNPGANNSVEDANASVIHENNAIIDPVTEANTTPASHESAQEPVQTVQQAKSPDGLPLTIEATNVNMDPEGMPIPSGVYPLGIFRFATASLDSSSASLESIIFTVETANVVIGAQEFRFYTLEHPEQKIACTTLYSSGEPFMSQQISGKFIVRCSNLASSNMVTTISAGSHADIVLEGNVIQSQLSAVANASVQVSVERMGEQNGIFGIYGSRTRWIEQNIGLPIHILPAVEPVRSTKYSS
jgi:cysteine-rich repeat protein